MKRGKFLFFTTLLLFLLLIIAVSAHPGRTDGAGGHTDHSTGEYHYHHGYPAHQHTNGECPYDFDDKTNHSSTKNDNVSFSDFAVIPFLIGLLVVVLMWFSVNKFVYISKKMTGILVVATFGILFLSMVIGAIIYTNLYPQ